MALHTDRAEEHQIRRWFVASGATRQTEHAPKFGHSEIPRFTKLSLVGILSRTTFHRNAHNLLQGNSISSIAASTLASKLYISLVLNLPVEEPLHLHEFEFSKVILYLHMQLQRSKNSSNSLKLTSLIWNPKTTHHQRNNPSHNND